MANFKEVNKAVKKQFSKLDIEVVRGVGYLYFGGNDGFNKLESIMAHPTSTSTEDVTRMCFEEIKDLYGN
jgi:hypothetical protein